MCLNLSRVDRTFSYNWRGDQIVSPLVSAARHVPGGERQALDMDVREFLAVEHSAEITRFFLSRIVEPRPVAERERFFIGHQGNFDYRMHWVVEAFGDFRYQPVPGKGREQWLFPAETLVNGGGDCEDLSFLLMALLEEAGISRSCLRVAFGRVIETDSAGKKSSHDHAWVMYQLEGGGWMILDPLERVKRHAISKTAKPATIPQGVSYEYQPFFVFNRDHLWRVHGSNSSQAGNNLEKYLSRRRFWSHYNPAFAASVHNGIFDTQMHELSGFDLFAVKTASLALDANVLTYDPRDHCDFGYLPETWDRINQRLASGDMADLGRAGHAIADFYSHTLYAHVVAPIGGKLPLYDPANPINPGAKQAAVFNRKKFSINNNAPALDEPATRTYWQGKLISGQWWRWFSTYPDDIQSAKLLGPRRCLPDHDLLAVDDVARQNNPKHLYPTKAAYNAQFALREDAAKRHVRALFLEWRKTHGK